jgi:NADPH:quinone reductase-like Zn-dependent oxidoreductase
VRDFSVGAEVIGHAVGGGAHATYVVVPAASTWREPRRTTPSAACTSGLTTSWSSRPRRAGSATSSASSPCSSAPR